MRQNTRKQLPQFSAPDIFNKPETVQALENIIKNVDKDSISDSIYKGKVRDAATGQDRYLVRERLMEIYFNKCAYCEDIEAKPDVEHFRPKKRVTEDRNHPGYYWLCYEWTNLLPACRFCNAESGKKNRFPILGQRMSSPPFTNTGNIALALHRFDQDPLALERPFLLHPEYDTPDDGSYFRFTNNGSIIGMDALERGKSTIEICDLDRQTLRLRRQKLIIDETLKTINMALKLYFINNQIDQNGFEGILNLIFEGLKNRTKVDQPFSLFALYTYEHFEEIIIPLLPTPNQQEAVRLAMVAYKVSA